jgi:NAD(P)-dependent dehydrogenase (short-subunit alcohol dehydrogenase family)
MSDADERLLESVAVVTGAGSGLGRALARGLAARGVKVAALGRRLAALEETAAGHDRIVPIACDVSDAAALEAAFSEVRERLGPVLLLVNNAAVYPRRDVFDESHESFMQTVATNLGGTFGATRLALEDMAEAGFGRIVNVASFADMAPLPASAGYAVSKGAQRILTRALVADLADRLPDIVISDWLPGILATDMGVPNGLTPETAAKWGIALALWHDRSLNGVTFEMMRELPPVRSLKARLKDRILLRRAPKPRIL